MVLIKNMRISDLKFEFPQNLYNDRWLIHTQPLVWYWPLIDVFWTCAVVFVTESPPLIFSIVDETPVVGSIVMPTEYYNIIFFLSFDYPTPE